MSALGGGLLKSGTFGKVVVNVVADKDFASSVMDGWIIRKDWPSCQAI